MRFIESPGTDPYFNLALEQYVFDSFDRSDTYFMLWQNDNAVIIGKNQNTMAEVNQTYIRDHRVSVVRRLSGGGAVYHDLGNVNFTFIADRGNTEGFDFSVFCIPVVKALAALGVKAEIQGRNDMTIDGKKFSGNAQYVKQNRIMHHGTLMFDSDLSSMRQALAAPKDKMDSRGVQSARSLVTNIKPFLAEDIAVTEFISILRNFMFTEHQLKEYSLSSEDLRAVNALRSSVYDTWEWNYGYSPPCKIVKERRVEGCGKLQAHMNVEDGQIREIMFYGDYFGSADSRELQKRLIGRKMREDDLRQALNGIDISRYFFHMDLDTFLSIILQ